MTDLNFPHQVRSSRCLDVIPLSSCDQSAAEQYQFQWWSDWMDFAVNILPLRFAEGHLLHLLPDTNLITSFIGNEIDQVLIKQ